MSGRKVKASGKVFRDPVHKLIRIDQQDAFLLELLDTPEFQRLRRVRQLGVSSLTFHGAEHSRFAHSMGVFNFAQRILEVLERRYSSNDNDDVLEYLKEHGKEVKAAALLHDIGHGPFSHMLERAFDGGEEHEAVTTRMIRDSESEINKKLEEANVSVEDVAGIIDGTSSHRLLKDIVASQLDADRMDYLLRDALCAGVEYGHYDAEWLLNALCIGKNPGSHEPKPEDWRLCLDEERGLPSAEQFILARAHMSEQVYFHRVTRGYEVLLLNLFKEVASSVANGVDLADGTPRSVRSYFEKKGKLDTDEWLQFDEAALVSSFQLWARTGSDRLRELATSFLNRERLYKAVSLGKDVDEIDLYKALVRNVGDEWFDWAFDKPQFTIYKGLLTWSARGKDEEGRSIESILLSSGHPNREAVVSEAVSELFKDIEGKKWKLSRLYYHRDRADAIRPILKKFSL